MYVTTINISKLNDLANPKTKTEALISHLRIYFSFYIFNSPKANVYVKINEFVLNLKDKLFLFL